MDDKQKPEEQELFDELDNMYQRVADNEEDTVILEDIKAKVNNKKKPRSFKSIGFIIVIVVVLILAITLLKSTFFPGLDEMPDKQQATVMTPPLSTESPAVSTVPEPPETEDADESPITSSPGVSVAPSTESPAAPSQAPPAETKPEVAERIKEPEAIKEKTIPRQTVKPEKSLSSANYFAIQVGVFSKMDNVRRIVKTFKQEGLEAYWKTLKGGSGETLYRVLVGHFTNRDEADRYLKGKNILKNYPGSFIREVSASKTNL